MVMTQRKRPAVTVLVGFQGLRVPTLARVMEIAAEREAGLGESCTSDAELSEWHAARSFEQSRMTLERQGFLPRG